MNLHTLHQSDNDTSFTSGCFSEVTNFSLRLKCASSSGDTYRSSTVAFAINTFYKVKLRQDSFDWTMFITKLTLYGGKTQSWISVCRFLCPSSPWWLKSVTRSLELWKKHFSGHSHCPQHRHVITVFATVWKVISDKRAQRKRLNHGSLSFCKVLDLLLPRQKMIAIILRV